MTGSELGLAHLFQGRTPRIWGTQANQGEKEHCHMIEWQHATKEKYVLLLWLAGQTQDTGRRPRENRFDAV